MEILKTFIIVVLCFYSIMGFGENTNEKEPSFSDVIDNTENPDEKVQLLLNEADENIPKNAQKAIYYLEQAMEFEDELVDTSLVHLYSIAGKIYFDQNSYHVALKFFQQQLELQNRIDSSKSHIIYNHLGNVYFRIDDFEKARYYYYKALSNSDPSQKLIIYTVYNNLAVLERNEGNYYKALDYLNEYYEIALKNKDTINIIAAYHNYSNVYSDLKEYNKSLNYLNSAIELCEKKNLTGNLVSLLVNKGIYYFEERLEIDSALFYTTKSFELSDTYNYKYVKMIASEQLVKLYEYLEEYEKANKYLHINSVLSDEMMNEKVIKEVTRIELEYKLKEQQHKSLIKQKKKDRIFIISIISFFLLTIFLFLSNRIQRSISKRKKIENEWLEGQLRTKNKEMTSKIMHLLQVTEITNNISQKLIKIRLKTNKEIYDDLSVIIKELNQDSQGIYWQEFEKLFVETHAGFYKKLLQDFPSLSQNDIRLCAFIKLNLSTKEISAITKQSINSITVARSRLRKKLNIDSEDLSLITFLSGY